MSTSIPHAAETLIEQVQAKYKNATGTPVGEPDGFGVTRSVQFDKISSKWLAKVLPALGLDEERIDGFDEEGGQVTVNFSPRYVADFRDPFALEDAETVAAEAQTEVP